MEPVAKSTLTDAMNYCNPSVFNELFNKLPDRYTKLAPDHGFRLVAYIKFLSKVKINQKEITARLREYMMGRSHLMEMCPADRKVLAKPPEWNVPCQLELF